MFDTKDSGVRAEFSTGMVRDTQEGKPRFDLLLPKGVPYADQMLTRFAALMERGAFKYTERNWERARTQEELDRYHSSAIRHLMQWVNGETDEDHAAAVMFNIMAGEFVKRYITDDDRPDGTEALDRRNLGELYKNGKPTAVSPMGVMDGTFEDVCGNFNAFLGTNCLRRNNHAGDHVGPHCGSDEVAWSRA
jgi:hypothetical protein